MNRPIRSGLALVELVVVIAVLGLLLALIVPALQSGRKSGRVMLCMQHVKQLNLLTAIYHDDHRSFPQGFCMLDPWIQTPPPGGFPGNKKFDWSGWWWFHFLEIEDLSEQGILWCPARKRMPSSDCDTILCGNYGINYSIARSAADQQIGEFWGPPLRKSDLRQPSATLLYTDSGYALISWKAVAEGIDSPFDNPSRQASFYLPGLDLNSSRLIHPDQQADAVGGRHPGCTVNIGPADGHVRRQKAEDLFVLSDEQGTTMIPTASAYIWSPGL